MVVIPALTLLVAVGALLVILSSPRRGPDLFVMGPPGRWGSLKHHPEPFESGPGSSGSGAVLTWIPTGKTKRLASDDDDDDNLQEDPRPLLHLVLQRIAAMMGPGEEEIEIGKLISVPRQPKFAPPPPRTLGARPEQVRVLQAWRESLGDPRLDGDPRQDRWHRWLVVACFYNRDSTHGACETLDVRARTAWRSGTPPTSWPAEVARPVGRPRPSPPSPPTADLLLLPGLES